jgi:phage terminase Nu1 subunit (DNA packaging protein)
MSATVHQLHVAPGLRLVTKQQLAREIGRSERWIEMRAAEGMPRAGLDRGGRRLFDLEACENWLAARSEKVAAAEPLTAVERIEQLEHQMAELSAEVQRLRGAA